MEQATSDAQQRLDEIGARIARAQQRFGPPPAQVELIAVSKTFTAVEIEPFLASRGQRVFGKTGCRRRRTSGRRCASGMAISRCT